MPLRTKITLIIFGLFLFLILLEAGLRLGGFIILSLQEYRNLQSIKHKGTYRILCLGESTTADQWPPHLEEVLNQRHAGVRFSVIDKGVRATQTQIILAHLESNLDTYHPDMVVAMIGLNDRAPYIPDKAVSTSKIALFLTSFRTYKLSRLLWLHIITKVKEEVRLDSGSGQLYQAQGKFPQAEDSYKKAIELQPQNSDAYVGLGQLYEAQDKFSQAEDSYKKAIELKPRNNGAYVGLGRLYEAQGKFSQAEDSYKKAIESTPQNNWAYGALAVLYGKMGKPEQVKVYAEKAGRLRPVNFNPITVQNYCRLKDILDKKGIRLVCVQYPMLNIGSLKKIFENQEGAMIFVNNEQIFKDAVKKDGYDAYFEDAFAGDFGHCTVKGNRLLAANIANVILKEVFNK
jgi:tetratricopeptide (TPR) repeat protein